MTTQTDYEPFATIIQQGIAGRRSKSGMAKHSEHNAPRYVVQMCEALTQAIREAGNEGVTLCDIVRLEITCTGADYQHKLALRSHRLAFSGAA